MVCMCDEPKREWQATAVSSLLRQITPATADGASRPDRGSISAVAVTPMHMRLLGLKYPTDLLHEKPRNCAQYRHTVAVFALRDNWIHLRL